MIGCVTKVKPLVSFQQAVAHHHNEPTVTWCQQVCSRRSMKQRPVFVPHTCERDWSLCKNGHQGRALHNVDPATVPQWKCQTLVSRNCCKISWWDIAFQVHIDAMPTFWTPARSRTWSWTSQALTSSLVQQDRPSFFWIDSWSKMHRWMSSSLCDIGPRPSTIRIHYNLRQLDSSSNFVAQSSWEAFQNGRSAKGSLCCQSCRLVAAILRCAGGKWKDQSQVQHGPVWEGWGYPKGAKIAKTICRGCPEAGHAEG